MKTVLVTGVSGTLGSALAEVYHERGWQVVGVSRQADTKHDACARVVRSDQETLEDARALLAQEPDVVLLNAGAIETELGPGGLPLPEQTEALYRINTLFPQLFALAAAETPRERPLDVVAIGSIADGSPSSFGPVYHASKIALHYFQVAVAPIALAHNPRVRLRLYRPGVIKGPLSWAPVLRLNERGKRIRARRCEGAPEARDVALRIARFVDGDAWVGSYDEPLSFRLLRLLFALAPNTYAKLQHAAWRRGSRFAGGG